MNKTQLEYIKNRVEDVVKCTNGEIATSFNNLKRQTVLSESEKLNQIVSGEAVLLPITDLMRSSNFYKHDCYHDVLLACFEWVETPQHVLDRQYNERVDTKKQDMMTEVTLAGKRLIDDIVLGIVKLDIVPEKLHELASMTIAVRRYKEVDFTN